MKWGYVERRGRVQIWIRASSWLLQCRYRSVRASTWAVKPQILSYPNTYAMTSKPCTRFFPQSKGPSVRRSQCGILKWHEKSFVDELTVVHCQTQTPALRWPSSKTIFVFFANLCWLCITKAREQALLDSRNSSCSSRDRPRQCTFQNSTSRGCSKLILNAGHCRRTRNFLIKLSSYKTHFYINVYRSCLKVVSMEVWRPPLNANFPLYMSVCTYTFRTRHL